jgi:hypothetical protein
MAVFSMLPGLITNLKRGIDNAISSEKIVDDNIKLSIKYTFEKLLEDSFLTLPLRKHYNIASEMKTTVAHINYLRHHIRNDQKFKIGIRHGLLHAMQSKIAY